SPPTLSPFPYTTLFRSIPGADRAVLVVEHPHHLERQVLDVARRGRYVRSIHGSRGRDLQVAEIRLLARPCGRVWNVQARAWGHLQASRAPGPEGCGAAAEFGRIVVVSTGQHYARAP